ncbi:uncharacterized protein B0H18DRAFT_856695, partial [Fomitopsis serialis]|uniref:uncharacterized protein n=1 Tax=Fomitopsis serialis TaxID=139415 RepID=UPI002007DE19
LTAALYAVSCTPLDAPLVILSTNSILLNMMIRKTPTWEDHGWIDVDLANHIRALLNRLRQRCASTSLGQIVRQDEWKKLEKARQTVSSIRPHTLPAAPPPSLTRDPRFDITGAKLQSLTQALAYKGIIAWKNTPQRRTTTRNLESIRRTAQNDSTDPISNKSIWLSTRHKDFSRSFATFLWKYVHGALKCGDYWKKIPEFEHRALCSFCGETESIAHIFFECPATGQEEIWQLTASLWRRKGLPWPSLTEHDIHALGLKSWLNEKCKIRTGATRLWRILISEATHLIWKLRCDRVIGHSEDDGWEHSVPHVRSRFVYTINSRLATDVEATRKRYGNKALKPELVLATWNAIIYDELALPEDW